MNVAIIVAGGSGTRLGGEIPKQYLRVGDRELLAYPVTTFLTHPRIDEVIIVCAQPWLEHVRESFPQCSAVLGGETRQTSSRNGVNACPGDTVNVLIHDAARAFVTPELISRCLDALPGNDAVAPILPSRDSLVNISESQPGFVDRSHIAAVQTPQCFPLPIIREVHDSDLDGSDEIGMALRLLPELHCRFVEGEAGNYKVTTALDFKLAKIVAQSWGA